MRDRESIGPPAPDPGDEGLDETLRDFAAEAALEEGRDALARRRAAGNERLREKPRLPARRQEPRCDEPRGRDGQAVKASAVVDETWRAGRSEQRFGRETELFDEPPELRGRPHGVGSELEEVSVALLRPHDPARVARLLEEQHWFPPRREGARAHETREAAADDGGRHRQNARCDDAMSASAARNAGWSFRPGVLRKCSMPALRASPPKSWSIS